MSKLYKNPVGRHEPSTMFHRAARVLEGFRVIWGYMGIVEKKMETTIV